jgi:peptidoglycan/LPS O-acetylase OafA/YrhL
VPPVEAPELVRTAPAPGSARFRSEIQALRAVAVAGVVLYHLWPGWVPGGFVGVDIFFVISGFLITQ